GREPGVTRSPARGGAAASGRHNGGRTCPRRCWRPSTGRCLRLPRSVTARTARSYRFDPPGVPVPTSRELVGPCGDHQGPHHYLPAKKGPTEEWVATKRTPSSAES